MALANAVQGALRPSQEITWLRDGSGGPEDLTGATLTGWISPHKCDPPVAITGTLTVIDAQAGIFRWDYASADLSIPGTHLVQITAAFGAGATPARTFLTEWTVQTSST